MDGQLKTIDFTGMLKKINVFLITVILTASIGASAIPADDDLPALNPEEPDYYEIEGPNRLTFNEATSDSPNILIDAEDNLHLIWSDTRNDPDPGDTSYIYEIFYKKFDSTGSVIVDDTRLTDATSIDTEPYRWYITAATVALDSEGDIHLAYMDFTKNKYAGIYINVEIYYMKLAGDLDTGGEPADRSDLVLIDEQRISQGGAHSGSPDIAVDSEDNVHIVWYDHRSAWYNWEIYYEKLSNDGTVLIDDKRLTYNLGYCAGPELAVDSEDNLHVAFKSYDWDSKLNYIYYLKMTNDGTFLVDPKEIVSEGKISPRPYGKGYPLIVADSEDNIHMTWHDERDGTDNEVYYQKFDSEGDEIMEEPLRLTFNSGDSSIQAFLPVQSFAIDDNDRLYFGWRDNTPGYYQLNIAIMDPDGSLHLSPYQVTISDSTSETPSFAFDSYGYIHIAFMDNVLTYAEIYHIILKPLTIELALVPTGTPGSTVSVEIFEDGIPVSELSVERSKGNPFANAVFVTIEVKTDSSYTLELTFDGTGGKTGNGAVPMKVYLAEDGTIGKQLTRTVVNSNNGNNQKSSVTFEIA